MQHKCCIVPVFHVAGGDRDECPVQALAGASGLHLRGGKGGHLLVRRGERRSVLPMHGSGKEPGSGLVAKIKKDLGLA
ncbi:hypothetical protein GCM10007904_32060 [Oharaeibacter diazotrophicus]|nr:hypothetical protein GCM10007904_32060 [Oharaeibacter diazotrophicus]